MGAFWAVFGVVLSTLVLPLPEELALLGAGFVAHGGSLSLAGAFAASWLAIMAGDAATFFVGRAFLPRLLGSRLGRRVVSPSLRRWAEGLVQRHGFRAVLIGRFAVAVRGPIYLALGAARLPANRFLALNGIVGLFEVALIVSAGYAFGQSHKLASELRWVEAAIAVLLVALIVLPLFLKRRFERRNEVLEEAP